MYTQSELEQAYEKTNESVHRLASDLKNAKVDLDKKLVELDTAQAGAKQASDQLSYLRKTNECVSFKEYVKLKDIQSVALAYCRTLKIETENLKSIVKDAEEALEKLKQQALDLLTQIDDYENVYWIEDYTDDDYGSTEEDHD